MQALTVPVTISRTFALCIAAIAAASAPCVSGLLPQNYWQE